MDHLARATLLLHQNRYDLAEQEVRRVLGEMPNDPASHAMLSLILARKDKLDEAQSEAEQAIALAPDWGYPHFCRSVVLDGRKRYRESEASAREAVGLEPLNADFHARLAATLFHQEKWQACYDAAMEGLAHEPDNDGCNHLRTMALSKLGRQSEAVASVDAMLQREPDDAMAHANKGWALLHQSKPRDALEHFREALRIDPTSAYAQQGIVEALKARNPIYRWMLAYFLWMARLSNRARWGVIIGGYIGARLLSGIARTNPEWAPFILPISLLYVVFVVLTWFAYPFFNLMLRFNKFGWYALNADQRKASTWFGACLVACVASLGLYFYSGSAAALIAAGVAVGLALPIVTIYQCDRGWPRRMMMFFTIGMAAVGGAAIAGTAANGEPWGEAVTLFLLGFIATPWLANYLTSVTPTR
jgi:tetratricopeptide (TPR) repeat protein